MATETPSAGSGVAGTSRVRFGPGVKLICLGIVGLSALVGLGVLGVRGWRQGEFARVEREIKGGRVASAQARLDRLKSLGLGDVEADYWQAACHEARGEYDLALELWGRIPADSHRHANAVLRRARLAMDRGQLGLAERTLQPAQFASGSAAHDLREVMLRQIYLFSGQIHQLRRAIERDIERAPNAADLLRQHWLLDEARSYAVGALRSRLESDHSLAPDDDRVLLGMASLAVHLAQFDEAGEWLKKCRTLRPDDPAVWRAQLEWAMAADRVDEAQAALGHLPAADFRIDEVLWIRAWFAAHSGNRGAEERALEELGKRIPGDPRIMARLAEIAVRAGRLEAAAQFRQRKAGVDEATEIYRKRLNAGVPDSDFEELARLAETLGRWLEARGWWNLAATRGSAALARAGIARIQQIQNSLAATGSLSARLADHAPSATLRETLADVMPGSVATPDRVATTATVPQFVDDASRAGLHFTYHNDPTPARRMPETMGGGVGLIDYDGDGWLDVYAVEGGVLPNEMPPRPTPQRDRLYHNRGDGTFEDVTERSGIAAFPGGYGHGVAVGDYDGDGRPDLFVTRWRAYALYHNRGNGTFEDVTEKAGLGGDRDWPTSSAFGDLDGDGDLDLYVCHYSAWTPQSPPCPHPSRQGEYSYCGPRVFPSTPDHLFRNDGGRFVDVSIESGVQAADQEGRGLGVVIVDLDGDSKLDIFVANDLTANFLFRNQGGLKFKETGWESGVAANAEGGFLAGMGIACGDFDGDRQVDLAVTNFYGESTTFYQNLGDGQFTDRTSAIGLAAPTRYLLGFGTTFWDANNDGLMDMATANGHVNDLSPNVPFAMPAQLLLGRKGARLVDFTRQAGECWNTPRLGRGLALGDLDNDGRLDLLIISEGTPLAYFHNQGPCGKSISLKLEGKSPGSNRDAIGAIVTATVNGQVRLAPRFGGGSFLSASSGHIHFGLGDSALADDVEIRWPSGLVEHHKSLRAGAYRIQEGEGKAIPLPFRIANHAP